jgi:hypothetical protein
VPLAVAPTEAPAAFVSNAAFSALSSDAAPFVIGRAIADLHPVLWARVSFKTVSELRMLLETAHRVAEMETPQAASASTFAASIRRAMTREEHDELHRALQAIERRNRPPEVEHWLHVTSATAVRVGLLLSGSVDVAWRALQAEKKASLRADLVTFAVSEEHMHLRETIGLAVRG